IPRLRRAQGHGPRHRLARRNLVESSLDLLATFSRLQTFRQLGDEAHVASRRVPRVPNGEAGDGSFARIDPFAHALLFVDDLESDGDLRSRHLELRAKSELILRDDARLDHFSARHRSVHLNVLVLARRERADLPDVSAHLLLAALPTLLLILLCLAIWLALLALSILLRLSTLPTLLRRVTRDPVLPSRP